LIAVILIVVVLRGDTELTVQFPFQSMEECQRVEPAITAHFARRGTIKRHECVAEQDT
jgi:hypothetical protein